MGTGQKGTILVECLTCLTEAVAVYFPNCGAIHDSDDESCKVLNKNMTEDTGKKR